MKRIESLLAVLCALLTLTPAVQAQEGGSGIKVEPSTGHLRWYKGATVPPADLSNTGRLESLLRAGQLYLSLQDAIALALENNLEIAVQRYGPVIAQQDLQRAESGGLLRGVPQSVQAGPSGAGQGVGGGAVGNTASASTSSSSASGVNGVISQLGPSTPNLDPTLQSIVEWAHSTSPQTSVFLTGTNSLVNVNKVANVSLSQGFLTGTNATLSLGNSVLSQNSIRNQINPSTAASLELQVSQHLLQGFGLAVNNRQIRVAKNNLRVSDLVFQQQVIATVSNMIGLYWSLVSFNEAVKYARQNLALSQRTYEDNKKQVEIGTLAPIEIVRAEAEVAAREQDVTVAETNVLQQETVIKNQFSRIGVSSPTLADARIVPTDKINIPEKDDPATLADLVPVAFENRPELAQSKLNLENSKISVAGSKNGLLPTLDAFVALTNHGLAGTGVPNGGADAYFLGGYGTALGQVFRRNFPDYAVGVQLNIPLRNRAAQSDYIRDTLSVRQSELTLQQQTNQIRVDVQNSMIALRQSRAQYRAAVKQRVLQEQTLDAEQKKYQLGASTIFLVIQAQRDLAQAQSNEVTAESQYQRSRVNLEVSTGQVLKNYSVNLGEAMQGKVSRPASALPPVNDKP